MVLITAPHDGLAARRLALAPNARLAGQEIVNRRLPQASSLRGMTVHGTVFRHCVLRGAQFAEATLDSVIFDDCDLTGADFSEAVLTGNTTFMICQLQRSNFRGRRMDTAVSFIDCCLDSARFDNVRFTGLVNGGTAIDASFAGAHLDSCSLSGLDLTGATFEDAELRHASLARVILEQTEFVGTQLNGADLVDVRIAGQIRLLDTNLSGIRFGTTDVSKFDFERVDWGTEKAWLREESEADALVDSTASTRADRVNLYAKAEGVYRRLAEIYGARGYPMERNESWYRAMECHRKKLLASPDGNRAEIAMLTVRRGLDGYSTNLWPLLRITLWVWGVFAAIYFILLMAGSDTVGWSEGDDKLSTTVKDSKDSKHPASCLINAIVFSANSIVRFTEPVAKVPSVLRLLYVHPGGQMLIPLKLLRPIVAIQGVIGMVLVLSAVRTAVTVITGR